MKIIIWLAVIAGIAYFVLTYTIPFTESEVFGQAKELLSEDYKGEVKYINEGMYGEYMLHIKVKPKGKKEKDYYCGYSEINIMCSSAVEGLNRMVEESHSELQRISLD